MAARCFGRGQVDCRFFWFMRQPRFGNLAAVVIGSFANHAASGLAIQAQASRWPVVGCRNRFLLVSLVWAGETRFWVGPAGAFLAECWL